MPKLFDITTRVLSQAIAGTQRRHEVISNNIANIDTPNYRPADYRFEALVRQTLAEEGRAKPLPKRPIPLEQYDLQREFYKMIPHVRLTSEVEPGLIREDYQQIRLDGNATNIDKEMAKLAQNTILHKTFVELLNYKLRMLRTAIRG